MHKNRWFVLVTSILVILFSIFVFLLFFGGKDFVRALWVISRTKEPEERKSVWLEFTSNDPRKPYGGILAGNAFNRVWVWGKSGLKGFPVDRYSIYSWYDGCNSEVLARLNSGEAGIIGRYITTNLNDWKKKATQGDYVRVFVSEPESDGPPGIIREIYTYNFWLFLNTGMEDRCTK